MQLQDAFYSKDIGLFTKKLDSFYQTDLFFSQDLFDAFCNAEYWSEHFQTAVDLVYEAGC
jgi:hypothetical protein